MGTKRYELTDSEWNRIKDMLPPEHPKGGKRGHPAKCDKILTCTVLLIRGIIGHHNRPIGVLLDAADQQS